MKRISKILTKNDTGESGAHQAGITVPKKFLAFFPILEPDIKNPRKTILFLDSHSNEWSFTFIYYNNRKFGGTRNEYRLTGTNRYINKNRLKSNDNLIFGKSNKGYTINHERVTIKKQDINPEKIILKRKWRII